MLPVWPSPSVSERTTSGACAPSGFFPIRCHCSAFAPAPGCSFAKPCVSSRDAPLLIPWVAGTGAGVAPMSDPSAFLNALLVAYKQSFDIDDPSSKGLIKVTPHYPSTLIAVLFWTDDDRPRIRTLCQAYVAQLRNKNRLGLLEEFIAKAHCSADQFGVLAPVLRHNLYQHLLATETQESLALLLDIIHEEWLYEREIVWLAKVIPRKHCVITQENWAKIKNLRYKLRQTAKPQLKKALNSLYWYFKGREKEPSEAIRLLVVHADEQGHGIRVSFTSDINVQSDTICARV